MTERKSGLWVPDAEKKPIPVILRQDVEPLEREQVSTTMIGRKARRKAQKTARRSNRRR